MIVETAQLNKINAGNKADFFVYQFPWLIIGSGIFLRLFHYFYNRSLWYDEAHIALNIIYRDFAGLATPPLYYDQQAPIGFLWVIESITKVFGYNEYALRLFPLACGIASLIFFYKLLRHIFAPIGVNIALLCLAFAHPIIYHSVEVKQYETEMLATIIALFSYFHLKDGVTLRTALIWTLIGSLLLWFSFAVLFIFAGIGIALISHYAIKNKIQKFKILLIPFVFWGITSLLNYSLFLSKGTEIAWLADHWSRQDAFMPLPPKRVSDLVWFAKIGFKALDYPLGLNWQFLPTQSQLIRFSLLGCAFFIIGLISFFKSDKELFLLFIVPLLLLLIASAFKKYPVLERLLVFASPLFIVLIANGTEAFYNKFKNYNKVIPAMVVIIFALGPILNSLNHLINPKEFGGGKQIDIRQSIIYLMNKKQPDELVYITRSFTNPFLYYKELYKFSWDKLEVNESFSNLMPSYDINSYKSTIEKDLKFSEKGNKAWLLLYPMDLKYLDKSRKVQVSDFKVSDIIKETMDEKGTIKDSFTGKGVELYLYHFNK